LDTNLPRRIFGTTAKGGQKMTEHQHSKIAPDATHQHESPTSPEDNTFDIDRLRLSQDFSVLAGVKKALITIPVRKPSKQDWIRVHDSEDWALQTAVLELKDERETYLVASSLWSELSGEIIPKVIVTTINRQGVLALWPIKLSGEDGRHDEWSRSALVAAEKAKTQWIRLVANMSLGAYEVYEAIGDMPKPNWPLDITFQKVIEIAFKDRFIKSLEHPVIQKLRGEI
jgi:hypothetical protein